MQISRSLHPNESRHRLIDLVERFGISDNVEHRAMSDVLHTYQCYEYMKSKQKPVKKPEIINLKEYLKSINDKIVDLASVHNDDGFRLELKAMEYENNGDLFNAVLYYESCVYLHSSIPHPYERRAIIYRKYKLYDEELRIITAVENNVSVGNRTGDNVRNRKEKVLQLLERIEK